MNDDKNINKIIDGIWGDITGRAIVGDIFEQFEDDLQFEIKEQWAKVIRKELKKITSND